MSSYSLNSINLDKEIAKRIRALAAPYTVERLIAEVCAEQWGLSTQQMQTFGVILDTQYRSSPLFASKRNTYVPWEEQRILLSFQKATKTFCGPNIPTPPIETKEKISYIPGQDAAYVVDVNWKERELAAWYAESELQVSSVLLGNSRAYLERIIHDVLAVEGYHEKRQANQGLSFHSSPTDFYVSTRIPESYFPKKRFENLETPNQALVAALKAAEVGLLLTSEKTGVGKTHMLVAAAIHRYVTMLAEQAEALRPVLKEYVAQFEAALETQKKVIGPILKQYRETGAFPERVEQRITRAQKQFEEVAKELFNQTDRTGRLTEHGKIHREVSTLCKEHPLSRVLLIHFKDFLEMKEYEQQEVIQTRDLYLDELPKVEGDFNNETRRKVLQLYQSLIYAREGEASMQKLPFTATSNYTFEQIFSGVEAGEKNRLLSRLGNNVCLEVKVEGVDYRRQRGAEMLRRLGLS